MAPGLDIITTRVAFAGLSRGGPPPTAKLRHFGASPTYRSRRSIRLAVRLSQGKVESP
jgi:hypothetical protein